MATLQSVIPVTLADFDAGNTVVWISDPGIGKSAQANYLWKLLRHRDGPKGIRWGMCVLFMANSSEVRINGLPWKATLKVADKDGKEREVTITDPSMPDSFMTVEREPYFNYDRILFVIEEYGQGTGEAKRAVSELLRARGVHPHYLPDGSACLCLTNESKSDGVTKDYDFLINRTSRYRIDFDLNGLLEHMDLPYDWNGRPWHTAAFTKTWAKQNSMFLTAGKPKEQGPWCTPRSLLATDRYCQSIDATFTKLPIKESAFIEGVHGKIGVPAGNKYIEELQFMIELPQYEDVVKDPAKTAMPNRADLYLLMVHVLASRVTPADLDPVIKYVDRIPAKDMAIAFITSLLRRDFKSFALETPMLAWQNRNGALLSIIQQLTAANKARVV